MDETRALARFVCETDDVPDGVIERATLAIRDYLGVALYGTVDGAGEPLASYADAVPASGSTTVVDGTRAGVERAGLLNGAFGHAVDYDDTFASFPLHPTTVVVPAALAAAERVDADGKSFLTAYVVGVEVLHRVGRSVFPRQYERGYHSTAAVGPLGAAAAAGFLLEVSPDELARAFGIAASSAGGLRRNFGTTTKPLHAGFAARSGLQAALLARAGATADSNILGGDNSYGAVMADDEYAPSVLRGRDMTGVPDISLKLYPSAHITHGAMDALGRVLASAELSARDVRRVSATIHPGGRDVLIHADPGDALQAKFSLQFCLAAVLRSGDPGLEEFTDEYVTDPDTRAEMAKVAVTYDAEAVADFGRYGGRVTVETTRGTVFEDEAVDAPGSPSNPADPARLRAKFDACVAPTPVDGDRLAAAVGDLDSTAVTALVEVLRPSE